MLSFFRFSLLASLTGLCLITTGWAATSEKSWIVDTALPSLLRFNLNGEVVSSDLSDYIRFTCHGVGKDKTCSIDDSNTDIMDMSKILHPSSSDSIQSYETGVALYFVIAVLGAILVILGTLLYIVFFCGFDFCCVTSCFRRKAFFKKTGRQICAVTFLALFFAFLVAVIILCYTHGISSAFDGVSETSDAPEGFATVAYRMGTALMPAYVALVGNVVMPTLRTLNSTVNAVVNYESVVNDLEILNATVGRLPNIQKILDVLDNINEGVDALNADITGVLNDYTTYQTTTADVTASTNVLMADLRSINASLVQISQDVTDGEAVTEDLADLYVTFFGSGGPQSYSFSDTDGLIDSIQHDFELIRRNDTPGGGFPEETTATTAYQAITAGLLSGALNNNPVGINALSDQLHGIYDSMRTLPNYNLTADHLVTLNDTIRDSLATGGILDNMSQFLIGLRTDLAGLPNTTLIAQHAKTLFDQVGNISTASVYSHVLSMNSTIATLPAQVDILIVEAEKISDVILAVLPPLYDLLVVQAEGFNRTVMDVPVNTHKLFNNINKTVQSAARTANEFLPQLRDLQSNFRDDLDVGSYLNLISQFQTTIDTNLASLDESAILAGIASASVGDVFNATEALEQVQSVADVLAHVVIKPDAVEALRTLEDARFALESNLQRVVAQVGEVSSYNVPVTVEGDYWVLAQGVCSLDTTVNCNPLVGCASGIGACVSAGQYRCASDGNPSTSVVGCTHDSDCNAVGTYCLNDFDRATTLRNQLFVLSDPNIFPDMSDLNSELEDIRSAASALDIAGVQAQLDSVQVSIASANTQSYEKNLQDLLDSIVSTDSQFDDIIDQVHTSQDLINEVDISDYTDQLKDVQKRIDQYGDKLAEYMTLVKDLESYIFRSDGLNSRFDSLDTAELQTSMDTRGFGQTLLYTGRVAEDTMQDVLDILKNNSFGTKGIELTNRMREPARYMDRLTGNEHVGFVDLYFAGSLYYLLQMSNASADHQVDARDPMQKLVTTDINGDRYPDDKYCTTKYCFENQQDELESSYGVYLPLILIPLAVVCLIAIANVMCLFYPNDNQNGKLFCSRFLMCFIIVIVPWYLIFSGLIFAFTIAASDGCSSGPKIAANYVSAMGDDLCLKLDGTGTLTECRFTGNGVDVLLDLQAMTDAIIGTGTCSSDQSEDPFYVPLHTLAGQLKNVTDDKVGDLVDSKTFDRFRQPMKNIILDSSGAGAEVFADLIESVGYEVLTCENLSSMLQSFKEPVCYTSVGSWAWLVSCIYLASWCMCCMGIPAACALKNHYRLTILEELEEAMSNKKGVAKEFLNQRMLATRRGRGVLARKFQRQALYTGDVEMTDMDTGSYDGGEGGVGGAAYRYQSVSQDEDDVRRAPVPVRVGDEDPAEVKTRGFFAKYPKVSSKQNVMNGSNHSMSSGQGTAENSPMRDSNGGGRGSGGGYAAVATAPESKGDDGEGSDNSSDYGELTVPPGQIMQVDSYRSDV